MNTETIAEAMPEILRVIETIHLFHEGIAEQIPLEEFGFISQEMLASDEYTHNNDQETSLWDLWVYSPLPYPLSGPHQQYTAHISRYKNLSIRISKIVYIDSREPSIQINIKPYDQEEE